MLFSILVSFLTLFLIAQFNASSDVQSQTILQLDAISQTDLRITANGRHQSAPANLPSRSSVAELYQNKFKPQRFDHADPFLGAVLHDFAADYFSGLQIIYFTEKLIALPVASTGARAPPFFAR
ncbi:hypothetical protein FHS77_000275 [Paenochrobactrum gallinarii]|uniref:Uncharacterized protein n=1 Tax=Paenochrobactrum gallinarii TaxID=643673 RepID=A0A841LTF2_9HYPH|nr:hypothetical protein [Paenochrobactrum gallinarii]MBB6259767.1 hypothetical protein [Paenochrobactrum gallinarii]